MTIVSLNLYGHTLNLADHALFFKLFGFRKFLILMSQHVFLEFLDGNRKLCAEVVARKLSI